MILTAVRLLLPRLSIMTGNFSAISPFSELSVRDVRRSRCEFITPEQEKQGEKTEDRIQKTEDRIQKTGALNIEY
jgi:ribosome recycling factor